MESVDNVMKELDDFEYFAGPKIIWNKTKVLKMKELDTTKYDIEFTEEPIKHLGVYVGKNYKYVSSMNWEGKVEKINNILKTWKMRRLTCYGKIIIIKCLIIPQLIYLGTAVSMPIHICKALHRTIWILNVKK